jgi:hypothetical protein
MWRFGLRFVLTLPVFVLLEAIPMEAVCGLESLTAVQPGRSRRASSSDTGDWRNGNGDARPIPPGETLTLADLEGPGIIKHIWFTIAAEDPSFPASLVFRIYYDDLKTPGVESPLGDFFGVGHGLLKAYQCDPYEISSEGRAYNCFWRMPFRKKARLAVTNESDRPVNAFFYYIDWEAIPALPKNTAYFHAQYRQEKPCLSGRNYLICETKGRGHYVGTVLSVHHAEEGWFGEGDDFIYIDGEEEPSLKGTGTEDYFCDAWGFREFQHMRHGVTAWEWGPDGRGTAYRWHTDDPIRFNRSIRVEIEHKGSRHDPDGKMYTGFEERADDFASVAFWYQEGEPTRFADLPLLSERIKKTFTIEVENLLDDISSASGELTAQEGGQWSGGKQVLFKGECVGATLSIPFQVETDLKKTAVRVWLTKSWDYGTYEIKLDSVEKPVTCNLYSSSVDKLLQRIGVFDLSAGKHRLEMTCIGADPESKLRGTDRTGHFVGIDAIELSEIPSGAPAKQ